MKKLVLLWCFALVSASSFAQTINVRTVENCQWYWRYNSSWLPREYNTNSHANLGHAIARGREGMICMGDVLQGDAIGAAPWYDHWVAYGVYDHSWANQYNGYAGYWRTEFGSHFGQLVYRSFGTRPQYSHGYWDVNANLRYRQFVSGY